MVALGGWFFLFSWPVSPPHTRALYHSQNNTHPPFWQAKFSKKLASRLLSPDFWTKPRSHRAPGREPRLPSLGNALRTGARTETGHGYFNATRDFEQKQNCLNFMGSFTGRPRKVISPVTQPLIKVTRLLRRNIFAMKRRAVPLSPSMTPEKLPDLIFVGSPSGKKKSHPAWKNSRANREFVFQRVNRRSPERGENCRFKVHPQHQARTPQILVSPRPLPMRITTSEELPALARLHPRGLNPLAGSVHDHRRPPTTFGHLVGARLDYACREKIRSGKLSAPLRLLGGTGAKKIKPLEALSFPWKKRKGVPVGKTRTVLPPPTVLRSRPSWPPKRNFVPASFISLFELTQRYLHLVQKNMFRDEVLTPNRVRLL